MSGDAKQEQRIERKRKAGARIGKAWHGRSRELIRGARAMKGNAMQKLRIERQCKAKAKSRSAVQERSHEGIGKSRE